MLPYEYGIYNDVAGPLPSVGYEQAKPSVGLQMEEVVAPPGKQLRFRCNVSHCSSSKTFSIVSVMDHLAIHFMEKSGPGIFNYYCNHCRIYFYVLGMCAGCKCQARDPKVSFVQLKPTIKKSDIERETQFFQFVYKHAVPIFDNISGFVERSRPSSNPGTSQTVTTNHEDREARRSGETNSHGERRSRSTVRRQQPDSRQNNVATKRPVPPPLPRRQVLRAVLHQDRKIRLNPINEKEKNKEVPETAEDVEMHLHEYRAIFKSIVRLSQCFFLFILFTSRERRSRSTYRRPPVKSRQDGLLTENPSPPPVSRRQVSRSPGPRSRVSSVGPASTNGFPSTAGILILLFAVRYTE
ncbi:hypothetical protein ANCCAN_06838 [Ancylostoma caninum]|uniref:Uncharacterized protein n=1 Tax=Ancylostoma caninum TaxID=29170 RepID=A0A368GS16_ANCCA|nr:hypothetical protein ANCCAN_06838 [Ancylostoma caninum]